MSLENKPKELRFDLGNRSLAALQWGRADQPLILALHGWLDNAESFSMLAPLLSGYRILAIDLAGHGLSDWRSTDASYPVWSYVEDLRRLHLHLDNSSPVALLGHSLGAGVASLYAASWPESVSRLGLIENIGPISEPDDGFSIHLRNSLEHQLELKQQPRARAMDAWVRSRVTSQFAVPAAAAKRLMKRNTDLQQDGLYRFRCDPRLKNPSLIRLTESQVQGALRHISAPVKLITGLHGLKRPLTRERLACVSNIEIVELPGGHHLHLEENSVDAVAEHLDAFYAERLNE